MIGVERPAIQPNVGTIAAQLDEALGAVVTRLSAKCSTWFRHMSTSDLFRRIRRSPPSSRSRTAPGHALTCRCRSRGDPGTGRIRRAPDRLGGLVVGDAREVRIFDVQHVQHIKGMEFEAVFFVGIDRLAERIPSLYVGVTRAATYLGLTCETVLPKRLETARTHFATTSWSDHARFPRYSRESPAG
jgi:UvrD-like helicase C-terminal domain